MRTFMMGAPFFLALTVMVVGVATADSPKESPCIEKEATNGARDGETLSARIDRLELQLRLSKSERVVNQGKRR